MDTIHIGPTRGHITNSMALNNHCIWLEILALYEKLPHFHEKNIFLAQKMKKLQGFKSFLKKIYQHVINKL